MVVGQYTYVGNDFDQCEYIFNKLIYFIITFRMDIHELVMTVSSVNNNSSIHCFDYSYVVKS